MSISNANLSFHANGKLLLTGEYLVLDGAVALALPVRLGQKMNVQNVNVDGLYWKSYNKDGAVWFEASYTLSKLEIIKTSNQEIAFRLKDILQQANRQNADFLRDKSGLKVATHLEFPRDWGLGTSSTLIDMIAKWAGIDAFELLEQTMGGSGYDIACAGTEQPILYHREKNKPVFETVTFNPPFLNHLYFVYLGKKQNSREGIARYREQVEDKAGLIEKISALTQQFLAAQKLSKLDAIIEKHESIISNMLNLKTAKSLYFSDYWGAVKSLGAWGGDFVLVTSEQSEEKTKAYFKDRGFDVCLKYVDLK